MAYDLGYELSSAYARGLDREIMGEVQGDTEPCIMEPLEFLKARAVGYAKNADHYGRVQMIETIKIGPTRFHVKIVEGLRADDDEKLDGQIQYGSCTISIDAGLVPQVQYQVMWHEIIHGILKGMGLDAAAEGHRIAGALSYGIVGILQDNPGLCDPDKWGELK